MSSPWMIDGRIDLTAIGERVEWHRQSFVDALLGEGLSRDDAESFTDFAFNEHAIENNGTTDSRSEDLVSDEQWNRLTF